MALPAGRVMSALNQKRGGAGQTCSRNPARRALPSAQVSCMFLGDSRGSSIGGCQAIRQRFRAVEGKPQVTGAANVAYLISSSIHQWHGRVRRRYITAKVNGGAVVGSAQFAYETCGIG